MPQAIDSHLPEGREPGPQSRRRIGGSRVSGLVLPTMTVLFIACFIGIPLAVVSVTDAQGVIYATLGVLALVFVVGMWMVARRFRSAPLEVAGHFEVLAEPLELRRGEEVDAELAILDLTELGEGVEVGLVCVERYDRRRRTGGEDGATVERVTEEAIAYERWLPAWRTEEVQTFSFRVPQDAPYSHEGDCLSFAWRVSARDRERQPEDATSDDPIWVLP